MEARSLELELGEARGSARRRQIGRITAGLALVASVGLGSSARAESSPSATSKHPIFMGGPVEGWSGGVRGKAGEVSAEDVPAEVGWVRDISPKFRTETEPLGWAREIAFSAKSSAQYAFLSDESVFDSRRLRRKFRRNSHLVFNLKLLDGVPRRLRLGLTCPKAKSKKRKSSGGTSRCRTTHALSGSALPAHGLWQTLRLPLGKVDSSWLRRLRRGKRAAVVLEVESGEPVTLRIANLRLEAYPKGYSFADAWAKDLLGELDTRQKIGQVAQLVHRAGAEADPVLPSEAAGLGIGSLFGDSSTPPHDQEGNLLPDDPETWVAFLRSYQEAALSTDAAIPILFGMDAVHGLALVPGATVFPHNIGLGATRDAKLIESVARATAREAAALGFRLTFSPSLSVARDERWGRTYESLSEVPGVVGRLGEALVRGYQGAGSKKGVALGDPQAVLACPKHFGGDGASEFAPQSFCTSQPCGTGYSVDRGNTELDLDSLLELHLSPYRRAIDAGAGVIMSADSRWQGEVMTGNPLLMTEVLREGFGFEGILLTDYRSWAQVDPDPEAAMLQTLNAGHDLVMLPSEADYAVLEQAVRAGLDDGRLDTARLDEAVLRVLKKKLELELFDVPFAQPELLASVGSAPHRELARRAVRESLVLLQNTPDPFTGDAVLPLSPTARLYVAGKAANDLGIQSGGWTDTWQGTVGNALPGATLLGGVREVSEGEVVFSPDASVAMAEFDAGIVFVGEYPYAEFCGDVLGTTFFCEFSRPSPEGLQRGIETVPLPIGLPPPQSLSLDRSSFDYFSPFFGSLALPVTVDPVSDLEVATRVCSQMPCVVVLVSGRPLFIEPVLQVADALVAAWLPGGEGGGVADVLFARDGEDFRGRLEHTWPRTPSDPLDPSQPSATPELDYVPQNDFVDGRYGNLDAVLFARGHGLSYQAKKRRRKK